MQTIEEWQHLFYGFILSFISEKMMKEKREKKSISTVTFQEFALACATTSQYVIFFIQFREDNKQKEIFIC